MTDTCAHGLSDNCDICKFVAALKHYVRLPDDEEVKPMTKPTPVEIRKTPEQVLADERRGHGRDRRTMIDKAWLSMRNWLLLKLAGESVVLINLAFENGQIVMGKKGFVRLETDKDWVLPDGRPLFRWLPDTNYRAVTTKDTGS